jgi:hypothetical protein
MHGRQQNCMGSMPFDFNPNYDFAAYANNFQDPAAIYQQSYPFPMMTNDLGIDPNDTYLLPHDQSHFSIMSSSQGLNETILQSVEQDDTPIPAPFGIGFEPLSKTTTESRSTECSTKSSSSNGSPPVLANCPSDDAMDLTAPEMDPFDMTSSLRTSNSKALLDELRCQCLHRHAKLLAHLQELLEGLADLPVDVVLNGVEQGLKSWDTYLQCRTCQHDQHREVLLLSAVSIRAVTRLLQGSSRRLFSQSTSADRMRGGNMHAQPTELQPVRRDTRFTFGSYEIKGEESLLVLGVLVSRILAKIEIVLASLKKSLPCSSPDDLEGPDSDIYTNYLHKLLEGLEATVHVLSANLMEWRL